MNQPSGDASRIRLPNNSSAGGTTSLCDLCKNVCNSLVHSWLQQDGKNIPSRTDQPASYPHQPSWDALQKSALDGCTLCLRLASVADDRFCRLNISERQKNGRSTAFTFHGDADYKISVTAGMPWAKFEALVLPG
jgi:hypothetical protein